MEESDPRDIVTGALGLCEIVCEVGDEVATCCNGGVYELELVMFPKIHKALCLSSMIGGSSWFEGTGSEMMNGLLKLGESQWVVVCKQIT